MIVPNASDRGILRRGFLTSPAVKVMLFHASAENSDPVCETHNATKMPYAVSTDTPGLMGSKPRGCQRSPKLALTADAFRPISTPAMTIATSVPVLVTVNEFWM